MIKVKAISPLNFLLKNVYLILKLNLKAATRIVLKKCNIHRKIFGIFTEKNLEYSQEAPVLKSVFNLINLQAFRAVARFIFYTHLRIFFL